jgi:hypothetical protein
MARKDSSRCIWITTRLAIYARDRWECLACTGRVTCARDMDEPGAETRLLASLDHLSPGRDHRHANLVTLCVHCNAAKGERHLRDWRPDLLPEARRRGRRKLDFATARELARALGYGERLRRAAERAALAKQRRADGVEVHDFDPLKIEAQGDGLPLAYGRAA